MIMFVDQALVRDSLSKPKTVGDGSVDNLAPGSGQTDNHKRKILPFVNDEICSIMLDISFQRMLKKEKSNPGNELAVLELWSDDVEGMGDFGQYRAKLVSIYVRSNWSINHLIYLFHFSNIIKF